MLKLGSPRSPSRSPRAKIGTYFEQQAESYLHNEGLKTVTCNYRWRGGEIDLIMLDGETVVFVEVRYRATKSFVDPVATVTSAKQRRIIRSAERFLAANVRYAQQPCRFDVVGISEESNQTKINWIANAFST